jgi:hypothetical protein
MRLARKRDRSGAAERFVEPSAPLGTAWGVESSHRLGDHRLAHPVTGSSILTGQRRVLTACGAPEVGRP